MNDTEKTMREALRAIVKRLEPTAGYAWAVAADVRAIAEKALAATPEQRAEPDMRAVCESLGFDPTNHHNADKCPYCRGQRAEPASAEDRKVYEAIADNYFKDTQQAEPQGLTEDEIRAAVGADTAYWATSKTWIVSIARTIESALAARASAGRADK